MDDRTRWDARYRNGAYAERPWPSTFLEQNIVALPSSGGDGSHGHDKALDLACGAGRNSVFLAQHGFTTQGIDISAAAIAAGSAYACQVKTKVAWRCQNLLEQTGGKNLGRDPIHDLGHFQLIILFRFVAPGLLTHLMDHLLPGVHLMVEEHLQHDLGEQIVGPRNPDFRVAPNALLGEVEAASQSFDVIEHFAGLVAEPSGEKAAVSRLWVQRHL